MKSNCCNADVRVEGNTTKYYVCTECGNACDIIMEISRIEVIGKKRDFIKWNIKNVKISYQDS